MARQLFIGIDPGAKGAICALDPVAGKAVFYETTENGRDILAWFEQVAKEGQIRAIMIEEVASVPQSSAKANFEFGRNVERVNLISELTGIMVDKVRPKAWQKEIGLSVPQKFKGAERKKRTKYGVADICKRLYPKIEIHGPKGGLQDGKSDAAMIAHHCYLKHKIS